MTKQMKVGAIVELEMVFEIDPERMTKILKNKDDIKSEIMEVLALNDYLEFEVTDFKLFPIED